MPSESSLGPLVVEVLGPMETWESDEHGVRSDASRIDPAPSKRHSGVANERYDHHLMVPGSDIAPYKGLIRRIVPEPRRPKKESS